MKSLALVTGAGIGIGAETARRLSRAGHHVIVTDIINAEGEKVAAEIAAAGGSAEYLYMDVADTKNVDAVVSEVMGAHGQSIDILVNNAGIAKHMPLSELSDDQWDWIHEVDLKGMMRVTRAVLPGMRDARRGSIICLSSIAGPSVGWGNHVPYAAAKAGVGGLVRAAAIETAEYGIRVNGVAPGLIRTAQTLDPLHSLGAEGLESAAPGVPLGRIGTPEDIANVINFLSSDEAAYITGQILIIDGGLTISL
ncbi:MAG: 3-oxoacyl-[acyl-carrier protein] reductase [Alcanivorax sp.]|jgi:3-oxoacyl-[acyl-carrier protein] reductase